MLLVSPGPTLTALEWGELTRPPHERERRGWPIVETSRLPRVSVGDVRSWGRLGQRVVASAVGAIVSRGTRPVEDVDELDAGDVPGAVLVNPDLFEDSEDRVLAHGRA